MNNKSIASFSALTLIATPVVLYAATGLIPCDGPNCGFNDLMVLANTIIHFLMYDVAIPLTAIGLMWAGGRLILSQEKESAWSQARGAFTDIATGFFIMLGAYVLIKTILYQFLNTDAGYTLFLFQ